VTSKISAVEGDDEPFDAVKEIRESKRFFSVSSEYSPALCSLK